MLKVNYSDIENVNLYFDGKVFEDDVGVLEIVLSVVFVVSMVLSVVGNACTCAVIIRDRSMRTPTNYYLLNLAVADLMTALFLPLEITVLWVPNLFGQITGNIVFLFWDLLCNCSVLTILALTIERYLVISKPFLRHTFVLSSRVFKILAINWTIATFFCVLNLFFVYNIEDPKYVYIYFTSTSSAHSHIVILRAAEVVIFFIFPMVVIAMLYALITLKLKTKNSLRHSPTFVKQNRSKAIKMLAAIAASFFICWSPFCALRIMATIPKLRHKDYTKIWQFFCYMNCVNSYASTAVNPILYSLMSSKFRRAFKDLLKGRKVANRRTSVGLQANTSIYQTPNGNPKTIIKSNNVQNRIVYNRNYSFC